MIIVIDNNNISETKDGLECEMVNTCSSFQNVHSPQSEDINFFLQ